jgi:hypothetical protein
MNTPPNKEVTELLLAGSAARKDTLDEMQIQRDESGRA